MFDFLVIGGGIVGLSTAWQLQRQYPNKRVLLLEKESVAGCHQTGHNSGVIHAGVYYPPGSLKAEFCNKGLEATIKFCRERGIPVRQPGKLVVATNEREQHRLLNLAERCHKNNLPTRLLSTKELEQKEPHVTGLGALHVASTGIVDYQQIAAAMATEFQAIGGELLFEHQVISIQESKDEIVVDTSQGHYRSRFLIACAGLQADRIAAMMGLGGKFQIIPFRGEYYRLAASKSDIVQHLIYPVPNPKLPFLGVHLTPMIDGSITVGPNALLGWKREGYGRINVDINDTLQMLGSLGLWRLLAQHWQSGLGELRDAWSKANYLKRVQKYCPQLSKGDLLPHPNGVRAQAVLNDGSLVHDFLFESSPRSLHVCNAPSPAATSAIPIGAYICQQVAARLD